MGSVRAVSTPPNLDSEPLQAYLAAPFSGTSASVLFTILTLFPEAIAPYLDASILGIARRKGAVDVRLVDFRDFTRDRHRTVDDRPYGGGPGMVLKPEPILDAVEWLEREQGPFRKIMLSPQGARFDQARARGIAESDRVLLLCGRYEGFDERIRDLVEWEELSIGDFVLAGGELPALCVVEAVARLLPGVLGDERSAVEESFQDGSLLDHPHYTRPRSLHGHEVPQVLLEGDHARIAAWRRERALERTRARRPDLTTSPSEPPRLPDSAKDPSPAEQTGKREPSR